MAGFVNNNQIFALSGAYDKHWDTFKKQIIVLKEPTKTIVTSDTNNSPIFGYGEESQSTISYSYTTVTGVYDAQVTVNLNQKTAELEEAKAQVGRGQIRVKVKQDCRDFIEDGRKTEGIRYAGQTYNVVTFDGLQDFFGLKFYMYFLERSA